MLRPPPRALAAWLTAASLLALTVPAGAEDAEPDGTTTTSTTEPGEGVDGTSTPTSTTDPEREATTSTTEPGADADADADEEGDDTTPTSDPDPDADGEGDGPSSSTTSTSTSTSTTLAPGEVPPEIQAMIDAYPRTPARSTDRLVAALAALPPRAAFAGFGRVPVAGTARWSHDWLFPRHVPNFHVHKGTDVFAAAGTPVLAPAAGTARVTTGAVGGLAVSVVQPDGTYWYLAHLAEATVADGTPVTTGVMVGAVGDSGNARGGAPHVHVEVHPHGGAPIDPKPLLDLALADALAAAPTVVEAHRARALLTADPLVEWLDVADSAEPEVGAATAAPLEADVRRPTR